MTFEHVPNDDATESAPPYPNETFTAGTYGHALREVLQQKIDTEGRIVGAEALVRSAEGSAGGIPDDLLEYLKQHSETHALTMAVFRRSCEQLAYWNEKGLHFPISVNIEVDELVPNLATELDAVIVSTGAPRDCIELEITERTRLTKEHRAVMEELRALGIRLALDDYGSGAADDEALQYFKRGDTIKVDRALVENGTAYDRARELQEKGFHVVIEGVPASDRDKVPPRCSVQSFELSGEPESAAGIEARLLREQDEERKAA